MLINENTQLSDLVEYLGTDTDDVDAKLYLALLIKYGFHDTDEIGDSILDVMLKEIAATHILFDSEEE